MDNISKFQSVFKYECQKRGIILYVLPPRSPKLNGTVERANRTHTMEFYEMIDSTFEPHRHPAETIRMGRNM